MKKKLLLTAALVLSLGAATIPASPVGAAATTAEFIVTPGELTLDTVPDLNFGTVPIASLMDNATTTSQLVDYDNEDEGANANQTGDVQVSDYRGSNDGWILSAQMTPFVADADGSELNGSMTLLGDGSTSTTVAPGTFGQTIDTNSEDVIIWTADEDTGMGVNTDFISAGAANYVTLNQKADAVAGQYDSDVTWTLAAVPAAEP
ncbi:WxL domain-containing protein [Lacticaseibacillus mingshuiensis]|uniref:WxL domain-containing protein n=1 Tax=Lacticaseibacillus mingshuiensis TaxID=2799574 RepID=UPI00194FAA57|nr:WxL domain-containing protein [Lacticaseibacillus mingshuiensis]